MNIYEQAIQKWGRTSQFDMVIEECAELIRAIEKLKRHDRWRQGDLASLLAEVVKECADVSIMTEQLAEMMGPERVRNAKKDRLARLQEMIEDDER